MNNVKYEAEHIVNSRGVKLFTCRWAPANVDPKALIFLCHGYGMECSISMRGCATRLVEAGYEVHGIDCEGHGKSSGLQGLVTNFDDLVDDLSEYFTNISERKENRGKMRILLGESMGGAMVLRLHLKKPDYWDGGILVAPMCKKRENSGLESSVQNQDSTITELSLGEPDSRESDTLPGPASGKVEGVRIWTNEGTEPSKEGLGGAWPSEGVDSMGVGYDAREEGLDGLAGGGDGKEEEENFASDKTQKSKVRHDRLVRGLAEGEFAYEGSRGRILSVRGRQIMLKRRHGQIERVGLGSGRYGGDRTEIERGRVGFGPDWGIWVSFGLGRVGWALDELERVEVWTGLVERLLSGGNLCRRLVEEIADDIRPNPLVIKILIALSRVIPTWKLTPTPDIIEKAIRDPQVVKEVRSNPYTYKGLPRLQTAHQLFKVSMDLETRLHEVSLPFIVLHGEDDKVTDPSVSRVLYESARSSDKTFKSAARNAQLEEQKKFANDQNSLKIGSK
ncbi:alpha/beta-Hydrolases superfamily protein [Striga asiatica]|uniref:Alpha/beta-Hydrolases superfamily protein n=1 Tax=Striga asiatica TaxID=4170 RepID=A0A5A7P898_STRAF|nr:alpha/beta-Hydrolases superfamily protein [Striga asiatica]